MENTKENHHHDQTVPPPPLSARILAQRARRDRERQTKNMIVEQAFDNNQFTQGSSPLLSARELAQRARRERERRQTSLPIPRPNQYTLNQRAHTERENELRKRRFARPMEQDINPPIAISSTVQRNPIFIGSSSGGDSSRENQIHNCNLDRSFVSTTQRFLQTYRSLEEDTPMVDVNRSASEEMVEDYMEIEELGAPVEPILNMHPQRHFLGRMDVRCESCSALHWLDERLTKSSIKRPLFGGCCLQGKIRLPPYSEPPHPLKSLYEGSDPLSRAFRRDIRPYNAANAFTSLGVTMDDRVLGGRGPAAFTIHGELHHRVGTLLPEPDTEGSYAQLYIYDAYAALEQRRHRNPHLRSDVLNIIQQTLLVTNGLCSLYKQAYEILRATGSENDHEIFARLHYDPGTDRRRYNLPTTNEIVVIMPGDGTKITASRDIILRLRNHGLRRISECHPLYLPSHYVLLFPYGELGWSPEFKQWDVDNNCYSGKRLTQLQYHAYRLFERPNEYSTILRGGQLYEQYLVDAWCAYEQNRLRYIRKNQKQMRTEVYHDLTNFAHEGADMNEVGKRLILPSSHPGSPRYMYEIYQDSMAITRYNKHPDIFLTFTANPNWPEIRNELRPHETASSRPELVDRVFELKREAIMKEIIEKELFGKVAAYVFTIEFQKRGLPHMHALIFLKHPDKINNPAQVDRIVCAEFPDPETQPLLFETMKKCMIHGPCGTANPFAQCMIGTVDKKCKSKYPRKFVDFTLMDQNGYPIYRRRDTGKSYEVRGRQVDNRDVVPYNPYLTEMFDCHINVEVCASVRAVKYIHKYIYKGFDKATMVFVGVDDEIQQYIDARYVGSIEAAHHILQNPMHKEWPNVVRLALHLPGMHKVPYNPNDTREEILARAEIEQSKLTAFFKYYAENPNAVPYTYQQFPEHFVWENKEWHDRKQGFAIGRIYFASPNSGERFYLRLLLTAVKGPKSFEDLKKVGTRTYNSFKEACIARGLLEDDAEWAQCLEEAATMKTGHQLRKLFSLILMECSPSQPYLLLNRFATQICDDCEHKLKNNFYIEKPSEDQIKDYGLFLLQQIFSNCGKKLSDIPGMPLPTRNWKELPQNRLIWEHQQYRHEGLEEEANSNVSRLNKEQMHAYTQITNSVMEGSGKMFFLNGAAGTGKTFVYNTVAAACRNLNKIVVMVASSGIASLLLTGGRTAHSTFKIPFDVMNDTICDIGKNSDLAELLKQTSLIVWDEVPMQHRFCVEAVDRTLQDIRNDASPFGGITVVMGGDFRQTLPVIPKGDREDFVGASLQRSPLWGKVQVLNLVKNMRLDAADPDNILFANYLTEVGSNPTETVELPPEVKRCQTLEELINSVYPGLVDKNTTTPLFLTERTILSALNDDVSNINEETLRIFPGETDEYLAADKVIEDESNSENNTNKYTTEYLNTLNPSSLPPYKLKLKKGCPIMLLRNIAPSDGLCNGTRLMVLQCKPRVIEALILTGSRAGDQVFIPRITLTPSTSEMPFQMSRRQFPIRLAYAMTINKSQGQSVKYVGIDLRTPVFSHGQLYVALSRCTSSKRTSIILPGDSANSTTNIVYPEVLL